MISCYWALHIKFPNSSVVFIPGFGMDFEMLITGRVFTGFCVGFVTVVVPAYIGEIASPDIRGILGAIRHLYTNKKLLYSILLPLIVKINVLNLKIRITKNLYYNSIYFQELASS